MYTSVLESICEYADLAALSCPREYVLRHAPIPTQDGDGTVVSPSALGSTSNTYYFDTAKYKDNKNVKYSHQNLTAASPVQELISSLLSGAPLSNIYISNTKPTSGVYPLTVVSSHSPVNLLVTDAQGNQSGVVPIPGTDFSGTVSNIPGSSMFVMGDEDYVYLPQSGTYSVVATGYGTGLATIEVGTTTSNGTTVATTQSFTDIPIATSTKIALTVNSTTATSSALSIDEKGDGTIDAIVQATGGTDAYVPPAPPSPPSVSDSAQDSSGSVAMAAAAPSPSVSPANAAAQNVANVVQTVETSLVPPAPPVVEPAISQTPVAPAVSPPAEHHTAAPATVSKKPASQQTHQSPALPAPVDASQSTSAPVGLGSAQAAPPGPVRIDGQVLGTSTASALSQTAAAINALPQGSDQGIWHFLYTWAMAGLVSFTQFLANLI